MHEYGAARWLYDGLHRSYLNDACGYHYWRLDDLNGPCTQEEMTMKVWPTSDLMRTQLKHPAGNIPFREEGPAEWPDDSFTHRRIMDGDVTTEEQNKVVVQEDMKAAPATKKAPPSEK